MLKCVWYLSVEAKGHRLVPKSHEEVSSVHLILQVRYHCVHCEVYTLKG